MQKLRSIILIFSIFLFQISIAKIPRKARKKFDLAISDLKNRKFDAATAKFEKCISIAPKYIDAHFQLGILYKSYYRIPRKTALHFQAILDIDSNYQNPMIYRILGEIYLHEGQYTKAKNIFVKYLGFTQEPENFKSKTEVYIKHCDFAIENIKNKLKINPQLLSPNINRFQKQYFPSLTADNEQLVYTVRNRIKNEDYEDLYISNFKNGAWTYSESISDNINTPYLNEGTGSISADGKTLVFTRCNQDVNRKSDCDLYISYKEGDEWTLPKNMGNIVNSPYWDSQPSVSADGKMIFFSSKRPGGMGEEDIWAVQADENFNWGHPINLGDIINTKGREVAPFIHPSQTTLYFASDYHPGFGSFDLFFSHKDSVNWLQPQNLGFPINTHLEESSIFITANGKKAYISAEAKTEKNEDAYILYEFEIPKEVGVKNSSSYIKGKITDIENQKPLDAFIEIINLNTKIAESRIKSDKVNGQYLVVLNENTQYALFISKIGYLLTSRTFDFINEKSFNPLNLDFELTPIKKGAKFTLNNIFFKTGEYSLDSKSSSELDRLVNFLNLNSEIKIEISGHTDNVGQKQNNIILSTKRAESVFDYLIEKGIEEKRINFKGYGDTQPNVPNDTEENKKLNRRIECKIL